MKCLLKFFATLDEGIRLFISQYTVLTSLLSDTRFIFTLNTLFSRPYPLSLIQYFSLNISRLKIYSILEHAWMTSCRRNPSTVQAHILCCSSHQLLCYILFGRSFWRSKNLFFRSVIVNGAPTRHNVPDDSHQLLFRTIRSFSPRRLSTSTLPGRLPNTKWNL